MTSEDELDEVDPLADAPEKRSRARTVLIVLSALLILAPLAVFVVLFVINALWAVGTDA